MKSTAFFLLIILGFALAGCASEGDPVEAITTYLQARVDSDVEAMRGVVCTAQESQIDIWASSFAAVEASLSENMTCTQAGTNGDFTLIACEGSIILDYGQEQTELPIGNYLAIQEDGEWKMCGEG